MTNNSVTVQDVPGQLAPMPTERTDTVIPYRIAHVYVLESGLDFWPCSCLRELAFPGYPLQLCDIALSRALHTPSAARD